MTSVLVNIVKQIIVSAKGRTVFLELACTDEYGAQVLKDDINSRLENDSVLALIVKSPVGSGVGS